MPLLPMPLPPFDEASPWAEDPTTPPSTVPSPSPPVIATLCRVILECDLFVYILYVVGEKSHAKTSF